MGIENSLIIRKLMLKIQSIMKFDLECMVGDVPGAPG